MKYLYFCTHLRFHILPFSIYYYECSLETLLLLDSRVWGFPTWSIRHWRDEIPLASARVSTLFFHRTGRELPLFSVAYHYGLACAAPGHSRLISSKIARPFPSFARFRDRELYAHACACVPVRSFFFRHPWRTRPTLADDAGIEAGIECTTSDRTIARTADRSSRRDDCRGAPLLIVPWKLMRYTYVELIILYSWQYAICEEKEVRRIVLTTANVTSARYVDFDKQPAYGTEKL